MRSDALVVVRHLKLELDGASGAADGCVRAHPELIASIGRQFQPGVQPKPILADGLVGLR